MNIVVIGDVLLDQDLDGPSTRLSPDGHAPVVDVARSTVRPGGAGLVARLLASAGHGTTLVTVLSDDGASRRLRRCLRGVEVVAGPSGAPTPVKTRVLKDGCAVVRVDEGCGTAPVPSATPQMVAALDGADAVVVADYGRGLLANSMIRAAIARCAERLPVVWDPHPRGADPVPGIRVATPNLAEALGFAGLPPDSDSSAAGQAAERLRKMWQADAVAVTAGADGAWLHDGRSTGGHHVPTPAVGDVDTCGAGDSFAAGLAVALAAGGDADLVDAIASAIAGTADFLRHGGVGALTSPTAEPVDEVREGSTRCPDPVEIVRRVKEAGGTVVATGGCFDLVHAGHLRTLRAARALGDTLIVCLNADTSVTRLKGPERPLMPQDDRAELLLALDCVDAVAIFDEDTPLRILDELRPDIWVKGGDYIPELLPEHRLLSEWGGRCVAVPFHPGRSTTSLVTVLERISTDS